MGYKSNVITWEKLIAHVEWLTFLKKLEEEV